MKLFGNPGPMDREEMCDLVAEMNTSNNVQSAHVVEFLGKPHVHADLVNGDIMIVREDGSYDVVKG